MKREHALRALADEPAPFDLLIVGGGATGLGAAVDAASRGHRVALVEQADFAKGTSSRSTKLVHGGVRYLRQGNISLVLEALRERGRLAQNAPHLVHDLAFVIPNYQWWEGPFYGIGMKVYDQLAGRLGLAPSRLLDRDETIAQIPTIETEGLTGGVIYHDGQFDDARLAVNLAETATEHGAVLVNYVACTGFLKSSAGMIIGAELRDVETGATFAVRARGVINATGVFADDLRAMDDPGRPPMIAVSQGIHVVLPKRFLPGNAAIMVPKTADGRVLFAVPWHDCVVVGTTDTPRARAELEPRALAEERAFVMEHARRYLSTDPTESDVLSVFAGLRPLVKHGDGGGTAALSRDHTIVVAESGLITITGGKWTTYRKMAEDVIDHAEMVAGLDDRPCGTATLKIHGAGAPGIYGTDGPAIAGLGETSRVHPALSLTRGEVKWHAREEMARTVEDVLARRSRSLLLNAAAAGEAAAAVAELLAGELGRTSAWAEAQAAAFRELARGYVFGDPSSTARD